MKSDSEVYSITNFLLVFLLLSHFAASGQNKGNRIVPSFRAGGVVSQIQGDTLSKYHKRGLSLGAAARIRLDKNLFMELGLYYTQKGLKHNHDNKKFSGLHLLYLNYIEIPVLFEYNYRKVGVGLGPSLGYLVRQREVTYITKANNYTNYRLQEAAANFVFSFYPSQKIGLQLKYSHSINSVLSPSAANYQFFSSGLRNQVIYLTFQFSFQSTKTN